MRIAPGLLTFEMWPDMTDYTATECYPTTGFTHPGGRQVELFSSDSAPIVLRHFEWMRDYGIDGIWLQHFLVSLSGGPLSTRYPSRLRVLNHVRAAALKTGRAWALSYDIADMPVERFFDVLTSDWINFSSFSRRSFTDLNDPRRITFRIFLSLPESRKAI